MTKLLETVLIANVLGLMFALFMLFVLVIFVPFHASIIGVVLYCTPCLLAYIVGVLIALVNPV